MVRPAIPSERQVRKRLSDGGGLESLLVDGTGRRAFERAVGYQVPIGAWSGKYRTGS